MSSRRGGRSAVLMLASGCGVTPPVSSDALAGPSALVRIASSSSSATALLLTTRRATAKKKRPRGVVAPRSLRLLDSAAGISRRVVAQPGCQSHLRHHHFTIPAKMRECPV
jgi:hypothetical protein